MATTISATEPDPPSPDPAWKEFAQAPLVPVALAVAAGLVLDRYAGIPPQAGYVAAAAGLLGFVRSRGRRGGTFWLAVTAAALAAVHHHIYRHTLAPDDIGHVATETPTPARVRGVLRDEPVPGPPPKPEPLMSRPRPVTTVAPLEVTGLETAAGWVPASGRVRLSVEGRLDEVHAGDAVQVTGRLSLPPRAANPGERDSRETLRDRRITAVLQVRTSAAAVVRLAELSPASPTAWLGRLRAAGSRALQDLLPAETSGLAAALLLGDTTAPGPDEWEAFVRSGVVHVLAISGLHLGVLAGFLWFVLRVAGVRRRSAAGVVAAVIAGYAVLTGARPSAERAAVMVGVVCAGVVARRPVPWANAFALAGLVVVVLRPTDPFTPGCQLSFLSVFVLIWGAGRWLAPRPPTPAEQLIEESRSPIVRAVRGVARGVIRSYAVAALLAGAAAPLVLAWQNVVSPIGVLLTPPVVLLTSVALVVGFPLLLLGMAAPALAAPLVPVVSGSLAAGRWLVHAAEAVPGGWVYAPAPSAGWLAVFYALLAAAVLAGRTWATRAWLALGTWLLLGLALTGGRDRGDETRVTFLAVDHGGCVVIEPPDGRVLLYDVGTLSGPDVARRVVAPFLWHRGVTSIDEVFLSHGDLDHFNGLVELLKRFPVGLVTLTPSFANKATPGVATVLEELDRRGVPRRVVAAGERLDAGGPTLTVLHPPCDGPGPVENENVRSLVLLLEAAGGRVLLTGDLEGEGQAVVRRRPIPPVEVMLAPHHGARAANRTGPDSLAAWARPRLVISSQRAGPTEHLRAAYAATGAVVWDTPTQGAVTIRCHPRGVRAEAFRTGEVVELPQR